MNIYRIIYKGPSERPVDKLIVADSFAQIEDYMTKNGFDLLQVKLIQPDVQRL